ncbi:EutN/CcmL family microcompartment protein [Clostridium sp. Ade.TY]|uniref:EutN/CcmL family microcompartment protein n=1 Tax=Clostridium sp. Ade.TY TaxID=1391647 RepID=UPI00040D6D41|nr:EutN/CcmL family microcompartment protein [Clostridium sp. Ade.TY]
MIVGKVIDNVVSTRKEDGLMGYKLLVVEPLEGYNNGKNIVAIDRVGAGRQSIVLVTIGENANLGLYKKDVPIDAAIVGIVDE